MWGVGRSSIWVATTGEWNPILYTISTFRPGNREVKGSVSAEQQQISVPMTPVGPRDAPESFHQCSRNEDTTPLCVCVNFPSLNGMFFFFGFFLRYENRTHIEIRNWTVASKGHSYNCGCYDGNKKACPRSITSVTLGKGQSHSILACVGAMTAAHRHVLVISMRWHQQEGSTTRKTRNRVGQS